MPYPIRQLRDLFYQFTTDHGVVYDANFVDYSSLFPDNAEFSKDIRGFNLVVVRGNINDQPIDYKIAETVVAIFQEYLNSRKNIAIYICDTTDERQHLRKRKFDTWFWKYNDGTFIKEDGLAVVADVAIYNSLVIHKEHPFLDKVIDAFRTLNERANDK